MEEHLKDMKMTNHNIKLRAVNAIKDQMHQIQSLRQSNQQDDIKLAKRTEARTQDCGFKWRNFSTPEVIKYISLTIIIWMVFAIYSYLHNRCMLYGGSNCVHINPFTFQNCNTDNYIF